MDKWTVQVVQNLFDFRSSVNQNQNLESDNDLWHQRRESIYEFKQVADVHNAKINLKNSVNQNFQCVEDGENYLQRMNLVAPWPKANKFDDFPGNDEEEFFLGKNVFT